MSEEEYIRFIQPYEDAMKNVRVRVEVLNDDYKRKLRDCPIHHIQHRIKQKASMEEKIVKEGHEATVEDARDYLTDIAGMRVICYFVHDIYEVVKLLKQQSDIVLIKESDYIRSPKPNGYRSYHMVLGVPVYHTDGMQYYPVEIQLRTMAMDLWASMEHRICYKGECGNGGMAAEEFKKYARYLEQMEGSLEEYSKTACQPPFHHEQDRDGQDG